LMEQLCILGLSVAYGEIHIRCPVFMLAQLEAPYAGFSMCYFYIMTTLLHRTRNISVGEMLNHCRGR